jgi:large conductance mechanosensitive channel
MKGLVDEFKAFAFKGNLLELAVAFILGVSFAAVVTSFVDDIIMPIVGAVVSDRSFADLTIDAGGAQIRYGAFITALVYFLIVALVLFTIVRAFNQAQNRLHTEQPASPTTKACPYCLTTIPLAATRCPSCTSELATA